MSQPFITDGGSIEAPPTLPRLNSQTERDQARAYNSQQQNQSRTTEAILTIDGTEFSRLIIPYIDIERTRGTDVLLR